MKNKEQSFGLSEWILNAGNRVVHTLFAVIILYLFLLSIFSTCVMVYTDEHTFYLKDYALVICAGLVCFVLLLAFAGEKIKRTGNMVKFLFFLATAVWFLILILIVRFTGLPSVYDQQRVFSAAAGLLRGDYTSWEPYGYMYAYPFQNGMVFMECPFLLLFGENKAEIAMQYANILFWYITILALSRMAKIYFGSRTGTVTYFALLGFIPMWFYMTFVYGTLPGLCFSVLALLSERKYEDTGKRRYMAGSLLGIFLGVAWKSSYLIFLIALTVQFLLDGIRKRRKLSFIGVAACLLLLCFERSFLSALMHMITGESVTNGIPSIAWVAMGLQESSIAPGWYNGYIEALSAEYHYHIEPVKIAAIQNIRETLTLFGQNPDYCLRFFPRKIASMWNNPAFQCFTEVTKCNITGSLSYWMKDLLYDGGIKNIILRIILDLMHSMTLAGIVLHVILNRKKQQLRNAALIITFLGGFLFHIVWEAMGHYAVPYYVLLFPYAAQGYITVVDRLVKLREETKSGAEWGKRLQKSGSFRLGIALAAVILIISFLNVNWLNWSVKPGGDESDYIWYCTHETQWKEEDYRKV